MHCILCSCAETPARSSGADAVQRQGEGQEGAEKQTGQEPQVLLSMVNSGKHQAHFQDG